MGLVKRVTDEHKSQYYNHYMRPSANYYPVTSAIMIEDQQRVNQMIIMNDRPQGGSAFDNGRVELMFNRRGYSDDEMGMIEPLNEVDGQR